MASSLLTIAIIYFLLTLYAQHRLRWKYSLILQFITGWTILELAWAHALLNGAFILMALGDMNDWIFTTTLGLVLTIYNISQLVRLHTEGVQCKTAFDNTLAIGLGDDYWENIDESRRPLITRAPKLPQWLKPFSFNRPFIETISGITYGPNERNTLDLYKPRKASDKPMPVMLQIHGGGWTLGYSERQGLPLRNKLVEAGWIFVSINYRLSPKNKFPAHIVDCKQALCWIKENIAEYGGDPNFIMTTGGSAGGHLCALLTLTANQHQATLQPGFETADTTVQGCIPMYGVYDFADRNSHRTDMPMIDFLEDYVMPKTLADDPELWELASPIAQANAERPPFMVVHGENDTLSFVEDARYFVKALRETGSEPCVYTELEDAQHAFDIFYSPRCVRSIIAMHTFAEYVYSSHLRQQLQP